MTATTTKPKHSSRSSILPSRASLSAPAQRSIPSHHRPPRGKRSTDPTFAWAKAHPSLSAWRRELVAWASGCKGRMEAVRVGNHVLDYLLAYPDVTRSPEEFCHRGYKNPNLLQDWIHAKGGVSRPQTMRGLNRFFDDVLRRRLSAPSLWNEPVRSAEHWNPIQECVSRRRAHETVRKSLPVRLVREVFELLTADDWTWPKSVKRDWVLAVDPATKKRTRVWNPVRASALALKLVLPLRTFQVRMLDSGEGDSERYAEGRWLPSRGPHAPPPGVRVRRGFLRAYGPNTPPVTGFYINTNKTAHRDPDEPDPGYEMPWQNEEAIRIVEKLVAWQEAYNPLRGPQRWEDVREPRVRAMALRSGPIFFLMRDPGGSRKNDPVRNGSVDKLWHEAVGELEDRLEQRGERLPDGSKIVLTQPSTEGRRRSIYDLHSLRVTLLTALGTDGGVPLPILSKCIAGHASLVMTAYYIKNDPAQTAAHLKAAEFRINQSAQRAFAQDLMNESRRNQVGVVNDPAALDALRTGDRNDLTVVETGICPVGTRRCGDGGPPLGDGTHGPVPGGIRNCVACRFHVTGAAFLTGLVARFNATSMNLEHAKQDVEAAEAAVEEAENRWCGVVRDDAPKAERAAHHATVRGCRDRRAQAQARLEVAVMTLHATHRLVTRALEAGGAGEDLVAVGGAGDLAVVTRETSSFELWDALCQAGTVHPCDEQREAVLRRAQALDAWLTDDGRPPRFLRLTDEQSLRAGNAAVRLLRRLRPGQELSVGSLPTLEHGEELDGVLGRAGLPAPAPVEVGPPLEREGRGRGRCGGKGQRGDA